MSYCDYNPRLFKEFTSMKVKVKPMLSNTWTLKAQQYRKTESCILSNAEGTSIADISMKRLLQLMKEQNISLIGDKLIGTFIIGNDRSLYTEDMYNTWKEKYEERISTEIPIQDLIEGHMYKTVCGSTLVYLGKRYIINARIKDGIFKLSKPVVSQYCIPYYDPRINSTSPSKINQKVIEDLGPVQTERFNEWELKWLNESQKYGFSQNNNLMYISKNRPNIQGMSILYESTHNLFASSGYYYRVIQKNDKMYFAKGTGYYGNKYYCLRFLRIVLNSL